MLGGSIAGTVKRGARTAGQVDLSVTATNITCATPLGNANVTLQASCSVDLRFPDTPTAKDPNPIAANVHDGTVDTSVYPIPATAKFNLVRGTATMPQTPSPACVKVSLIGGFCTFYVYGVIPAYFNENIKSVSGVNYQDVIFDGPGTLTGQSAGCFGAYSGTFTANQIDFNVKVTGGTTTGIDFRVNPERSDLRTSNRRVAHGRGRHQPISGNQGSKPMHLRKSLVTRRRHLAVGLLGLSSTCLCHHRRGHRLPSAAAPSRGAGPPIPAIAGTVEREPTTHINNPALTFSRP